MPSERMTRQRNTGGGGCLGELVILTLLVWPIHLLQPICGWSDAETGGLELAACGLLAIAASIRGRTTQRTAPETPNQDADGPRAIADGPRAIVAPRVAWDRSLVPSRRSNGPWADHTSNLGPWFAPGRIDDRRHLKDAATWTTSDGPTGGRRTRRARGPIRAQMRFDILQRDGFRCRYCGRPGSAPGVVLHVDHVIPFVAGGATSEDNLVTACEECNLGKAARAVIAAGS
jgi:5-methylcytosine-specific restriction endonuclease McrA